MTCNAGAQSRQAKQPFCIRGAHTVIFYEYATLFIFSGVVPMLSVLNMGAVFIPNK